MFEPPDRQLAPLAVEHPCHGCAARTRAPCGVLACESLAQFRRLGSIRRLVAGQTLFREGEEASEVFTVTRGSLRLHKPLAHRRRQVIGFMVTGDFLGTGGGEKRPFSAEALEEVELCSLPLPRFDLFIVDHPQMVRELRGNGSHELGPRQLQALLLRRKTAAERLAMFLLFLADQTAPAEPEIVCLPMTWSDLGDYLDLTAESVRRMLYRFEVVGLVRQLKPRKIEILNRPLLEQLTFSDAD